MLRVKLAIESRDAAARDGLTTATTEGALPRVEVNGAEGSTIQLHETAISEGLQAVCADEALWMPGAIGRSQVVLPH